MGSGILIGIVKIKIIGLYCADNLTHISRIKFYQTNIAVNKSIANKGSEDMQSIQLIHNYTQGVKCKISHKK